MLLRLLAGGDMQQAFITLALSIPAVILCLSVHEVSHGVAALLLGDTTARDKGRLTLDPMAHIDMGGFICMMIMGFGWAKPVPVNISRFKNRRVGMALTAFAGPFSNMVLAFVFFLIYALIMLFADTSITFVWVLALFFSYTAQLSVSLGVFNLIPVHPFDGSRILSAVLPFKAEQKFTEFCRRYQTILVLLILYIVWRGGLSILIMNASYGILRLVEKVLLLFL